MPAFYCDSSALVKCYRQETGTAWMRQLTAPNSANAIYIAEIAGVEVVAAITRQQRGGLLAAAAAIAAIDAFRHDYQTIYYRVALSEAVISASIDHALPRLHSFSVPITLSNTHFQHSPEVPS